MLKELYAQYGEIMVQMEVLQARLNQVKSALYEELKPKTPETAPTTEAECCPETNGCCQDTEG